MKKTVSTILVALLMIITAVGLYFYIDRAGGRAKKENKTLAGKMLERDIEKTYPPTPYSVAELYCSIIECLYKSDTTKEQIGELVKMERLLFDEEFAKINPYDEFLKATEAELAEAAEKKVIFNGYVIEKASNIEKWQKDGVWYASVPVQFLCRTNEGSGPCYRELILRRDKEDRYKILGWYTEGERAN